MVTEGGDRGRDATSPAEGWKDILWRVYQHGEIYARAVDSLAALAESLEKRSAPPNLSVLGRRFAEIITK